MKSKKKVFVTVLCAAALVVASVLGTMAYLTSTDSVSNTFTVGKVQITLDETDVTPMGEKKDTNDRVQGNEYKLIPGHTYIKDPTVHVAADSEDSWVFVKVENGISGIEPTGENNTTIAKQIEANGWTALAGHKGVYYRAYTTAAKQTDFTVFGNFTVRGDANVAAYKDADAQINVTAYAIQKDGFDDVAAAWAEVSK